MSAISQLFFPVKLPEAKEISFKMAVDAVNVQRIARITKAALFALSSVAATITLVLTEASLITWPLAIPAIIVTIVASVVFFRLNALDKRYTEGLDDATRSSLVKKELEKVLLNSSPLESKEVMKALKDINRLMGCDFFDKEKIAEILLAQSQAALSPTPKSIAEFAFEQNAPLSFSSSLKWLDQGRYGLPSHDRSAALNWSGNPADGIDVTYASKVLN